MSNRRIPVIFLTFALVIGLVQPSAFADTPTYSDPFVPKVVSLSYAPAAIDGWEVLDIQVAIQTNLNPVAALTMEFYASDADSSPLSAPCVNPIFVNGNPTMQTPYAPAMQQISQLKNSQGALTTYELKKEVAFDPGSAACRGNYILRRISVTDIANHDWSAVFPSNSASKGKNENYPSANQNSSLWPTVTPPCPSIGFGSSLCNVDVNLFQGQGFKVDDALLNQAKSLALKKSQAFKDRISTLRVKFSSVLKSNPGMKSRIQSFLMILDRLSQANPGFSALGYSEGERILNDYEKYVDSLLAVSTKQTITCIKGKLTKTVTAVKPVCPTGYKKK